MKKSDWALIIIVVAVVGVTSWLIIGSLLPPPSDETVKTAPSIASHIEAPENNVILYDENRPSWCPRTEESVIDETNPADEGSGNDGNEATDKNENVNPDLNNENNSGGRQYINAAFNSCAINSSFTTTTE